MLTRRDVTPKRTHLPLGGFLRLLVEGCGTCGGADARIRYGS